MTWEVRVTNRSGQTLPIPFEFPNYDQASAYAKFWVSAYREDLQRIEIDGPDGWHNTYYKRL